MFYWLEAMPKGEAVSSDEMNALKLATTKINNDIMQLCHANPNFEECTKNEYNLFFHSYPEIKFSAELDPDKIIERNEFWNDKINGIVNDESSCNRKIVSIYKTIVRTITKPLHTCLPFFNFNDCCKSEYGPGWSYAGRFEEYLCRGTVTESVIDHDAQKQNFMSCKQQITEYLNSQIPKYIAAKWAMLKKNQQNEL